MELTALAISSLVIGWQKTEVATHINTNFLHYFHVVFCSCYYCVHGRDQLLQSAVFGHAAALLVEETNSHCRQYLNMLLL